MSDQLEADLREFFVRRADEVTNEAVARVRGLDYKPRTRRRWPVATGALGTVSGTAAVVSVFVLGGSQTAFAGWSATPKILTADQSPPATQSCQSWLATAPGAAGQGTWTQVASDVRGPYTMTVYDNGTTLGSCFTGPSFTTFQAESLSTSRGGMAVSASGFGRSNAASSSGPGSGSGHPTAASSSQIRMSGGAIEQLLVSHLWQSENGSYTLVEGRIEPTVSAVTLVLSDGRHVTATTSGGWLVAWWPASQDVTAAEITSPSGTTTQPLNEQDTPTPPPPPSGSQGHGTTAVPALGGPNGPMGGSSGGGETQSGSGGPAES